MQDQDGKDIEHDEEPDERGDAFNDRVHPARGSSRAQQGDHDTEECGAGQ